MKLEDAIRILRGYYKYYQLTHGYIPRLAMAMKVVLDALEEALNKQKWIPVSERLPEAPGKYLVTVQNGNVYAGTFDKFSGKFQCAATAWMPLPEPYKEVST